MSKNLLDKEGSEDLLLRVQKLRPGMPPLWGSMTATEMLLHCNKIHKKLLTPAPPPQTKTSFKQFMVRWVVLYIMPGFPKNATAPKQIRTKGTIQDDAFEEQKQVYIELVRQFANGSNTMQHTHPYFGNLNTRQWGLASWKHADHHLRQFGV